ncbi:MAG: bifunctional protein-serine/threonine kinase/phosphatase [Thiotrichaceae bacterium]|nr:bifunctional protein-serine/threonine kinase/phosphatase [Thiotrichaceae bacterium]
MSKQLAISLSQASDAGPKTDNEDFFGAYIPEDSTLESKGLTIAIADGMSGSDGGKEASQMSVRMFLDDYYSTSESWSVKKAVTKVMSAMNTWLYSQGQKQYDSAKGMVTTFTAIVIKSQTLHMFHIGDSRLYRLRKGEFEQLTHDHRILISKGQEFLSRALGIDTKLNIDYRSIAVEQNDIYFLSTDGVHDFVGDTELQELIEAPNIIFEDIADSIVSAAKANQSDDNITCQLLRLDTLPTANKKEIYEKLTRLPFPPDLQGGNILDGFKIVRELQASSRSQVYLAKDMLSNPPRKVVIKTPSVNFEDDPGYIDRFLHEEWVGKRLKSEHLIKTYSPSRQRTFLYTVVEYISGQTLAQWIQDNPRPSLVQLRGTISQIAKGLRAMHRMEMIHQDLKPDNILLDENNTLKIIDFGSTKIAGLVEAQSILEHSLIAGTANYSAPEYFKGDSGTNRSDIYSIGVICYQMLTGKLPYGEIDPLKAHKKRFNYIPAKQHNPTVPRWIDGAIKKATHPDPEKRYALLSEFICDLSKPNQRLLVKEKTPLLQRNPLAFWQFVAGIELLLILYFLYTI